VAAFCAFCVTVDNIKLLLACVFFFLLKMLYACHVNFFVGLTCYFLIDESAEKFNRSDCFFSEKFQETTLDRYIRLQLSASVIE